MRFRGEARSAPGRRFLRFFSFLSLFTFIFGFAYFQTAIGAVSTDVLISEFRVRGPVGGNDEFVELVNISGSPVNIGGWKLRASNAAGTVGDRAIIPANTFIQPGCYYLLANSSTSAGPYSGTPAGNLTYSTGVTDDGGLAITRGDNTVVDQVGMTNTLNLGFREGTPVTALGTTNLNRGYARRLVNGVPADTDSNSADFQLVSPSVPQNAASACLDVPTMPSGVGAASPSSAEANATVLFAVAVTPGSRPASTGLYVLADMTSVGGFDGQFFYDDGTHGDIVAGDNIFSLSRTVSAGAGSYSIPFFVGDGEGRNSTGAISLTVITRPTFYSIPAIQGTGTATPLSSTSVLETNGVVTGLKSNGFFLQDQAGDGDAATSDGIFVFTSALPSVAVGDFVVVRGLAKEFNGLTEVDASRGSVEVQGSNHTLPTAVPLATVLNVAGPISATTQFERYEGMLLTAASITSVSATDRFSEFYAVVTGTARPAREPGLEPGVMPPAGKTIPLFDGNPERILVDANGYPSAPAFVTTAGVEFTDVSAPLDFSFGTYRLLLGPGFNAGAPRTATAVPEAAAHQLTVGSFNLENFGSQGNLAGRMTKAALAIRDVMRLPDIIGLQEINGVAVADALAAKVNELAGSANPQYVAVLIPAPNFSSGGDNLQDVGFLVKTSRVNIRSYTQELANLYMPGTSDLLFDRPPIVLEAEITYRGITTPVTAVVNHLRSLIDIEDPAEGPRVRTKRALQAEELAKLLQTLQSREGANVISVGDYNAFEFSDGFVDVIGTIVGAPAPENEVFAGTSDYVTPNLFNLATTVPTGERYSYVHDANTQVLDHVIVNDRLYAMTAGMAYARNNADFPDAYGTDYTRPERLSDHDMPVAYFNLPDDNAAPVVTVTGVADGATYTLGNVPTPGCSTVEATTAPQSGIATMATLQVTGGTANGVGYFTATCSGATDNAGNASAPVSATYQVVYAFSGFLPPAGTRAVNAGATLPVKFQLTNATGGIIDTLAAISAINVAACGGAAAPADAAGGSVLRFDTTDLQFIYNWKTKGLAPGCYQLQLTLDDESTRTLPVTLQ